MLVEAGRQPVPPLLRFLCERRLRLRGQLLPAREVTEPKLQRLPNIVLLAREDLSRLWEGDWNAKVIGVEVLPKLLLDQNAVVAVRTPGAQF